MGENKKRERNKKQETRENDRERQRDKKRQTDLNGNSGRDQMRERERNVEKRI